MADPGLTVAGEAYGVVLQGDESAEALIDDYAFALVVEPDQPLAMLADFGAQGMPGPPGPEGGSALQRIAGETLSALRAVYELEGLVQVIDYRDADHIDLLLGITLTAAPFGSPVNVQRTGVLEDGGWSWTPGRRVWLGAAGALTQTPPAEGFDLLIGAATSATRITLNLQEPIRLE